MSLLQTITNMARKIGGDSLNYGSRFGSYFFRLPIAGVSVNERTALNYSAVYRCVKAITDPMMLMPFRVLKKVDGKRQIQTTNKVDLLLHRQANPEMSASIFKEILTAHALTWGNGYAEIERDRLDQPIALWPIMPDRVTPKRDDRGTLYYDVHNPKNGNTTQLPADSMFHIRGLGFDGLVGYNVIHLAQESISMGIATEQFGAAFFGNGATLGTVISAPEGVELSENAVKNLKKTFNNKHKGARKAHSTEILDRGMKAEMLGVPPEQAQFLETRKFQLAEVARWFGVPLHKLMTDTGFTFKNVEQLDIIFVNDTLMPWNKRWEEEVDIKLLGLNQPELYAKFNTKGLLRGDIITRQNWYKTMFSMGVYSINEIRAREDEDSIGAQGDIRMVPLNMATLADAYKFGTTGRNKGQKQNTKAQQLQQSAPVFVDAFSRLVHKESRAIATIARKATSAEIFGERSANFYLEHQAQLCAALAPSLKMLAMMNSQPEESFKAAAYKSIGEYCVQSSAAAVNAYDTETISRFVARLEEDATETAMAILEKQIKAKRQAA